MVYIDSQGRLIYEMYNVKTEIEGFTIDGLYKILLLWEK